MTANADPAFIRGRLDAIELLAATTAAIAAPEAIDVLLSRCRTLREKTTTGATLDLQDRGFLSVGESALQIRSNLGRVLERLGQSPAAD